MPQHLLFFGLPADLTHCNYFCLPTFTARKLWRDYFASGVDGVVFIVDAVDRARFPEAKKELDVSLVCEFCILCVTQVK